MSERQNQTTASSKESSGESTAMLGKAIGVAAAVVAGAVAVTAVRKKMGTSEEEPIFHLKQAEDAWVLEIEGSDSPKATFETKDEGLAAARELAHQSAPCELVIYRTDGSVQARHGYAG